MVKNKRPGIPKSLRQAPNIVAQLKRLSYAINKGVLYRDVTMEARKRIKESRRWTQQMEATFVLQMTISNFFIADVLQIDADEGASVRQKIDEVEFEKEVAAMIRKMDPVVLHGLNAPLLPRDMPSKKFITR